MARTEQDRGERRVLAIGVAASGAVHGILLLLLLSSAPRPSEVSTRPVLDVELVELAPATAISALPPTERAVGGPRDGAARRLGGSRASRAVTPSAPVTREGGGGGELGLLRREAPARPDLRFSPGVALRSGLGTGGSAGGGATGGATAAPGPAPEAEQVRARVDAVLRDLRAAYQAQVPDAYWSPVREGMAERFAPTWTIFDGNRGALPSSLSALVTGASRYLQDAARYGRADTAGGGYTPRPAPGLAAEPEKPLDDHVRFQRELVVLVRVEQRSDGTAERIEVAQSSGSRELDRMAVEAARSAVGGGAGPTPAQGRRTLWAFTARYEVIPPVPVIGCPLDAIWTADVSRCAWPLKRTVTAHVALRGVD